jgi:(p)ppGpp synthase/HD superfamily hydrolase
MTPSWKRGEQLSLMIALATEHFDGILDKGGRPYILHCLTVMHMLHADDDEELQCIGIGHDLLEDPNSHGEMMSVDRLRFFSVTERVISGIVALTKVKGESKEEYKARVKANRDAVEVKKRDLRHNSDLRRLKGIRPKDIIRTIEYMEFYSELDALK